MGLDTRLAGIVQHSPGGLGLNELVLPDGRNRRLQIRNFKEEDSFILGRIRFCSLPLQAHETCAAVELGMMSGLLIGDL